MLSIICMSLQIQFLPSAVQGFYWYTGAVAYTLIYSVSLILSAFVLKLVGCSINKRKKVFYFILICILSCMVGGGNYVTGLMMTLVFSLLLLFMIIKKNTKWKMMIVPFAIQTFSFLLNVFAPGNGVRQGDVEPINIIQAVWMAVNFAFESANKWFTIPIILILLFSIPLFYQILKDANCSFRYPGAITVLSFGIFIAQFCPHAYALGTIGPMRLQNIIYFYFIFFLVFNIMYWAGWVIRKAESCSDISSLSNMFLKQKVSNGKYSLIFLIGMGILFVLSCSSLRKDFPPTSLAAVYSLITGEAKQYYEETKERVILLKNPEQTEVVLEEYTRKPMILFWDDAGENPEDWRNKAMTSFYEKKSVVVKKHE